MATLEERVAYLEGRVEDHAAQWPELHASVRGSREEMTREFAAVRAEMSHRFDAFHAEMNRRFDAVDVEMNRRFDAVDVEMNSRFDGVDKRLTGVERALDAIRDDMRSDFRWTIGIMAAMMSGVIAAVVSLAIYS